jgi:thymidylate synthase
MLHYKFLLPLYDDDIHSKKQRRRNEIMSLADKQYLRIVENVLTYGYLAQNRTGVPAYKLPHQIMQFDLEQEFPILTTKFVAFKTAVKELLWIYRDQSNDVTLLQEQNVHIWDAWVDENNTIGKGYGYQIAKYKQIDKLIETLKTNPQDRRMIMSMWNIEDLPEMTLQPCAFMTMWDVTDGRLNCMLIQRSGDLGLGIPFNMTQYAVLVHLIAQVTGFKPGLFTHVINNAHIYENHVPALLKQLERMYEDYEAPTLWINPEITNFYDFTVDDIQLINYQHHDKIPMEVAV